MRKRWLLASIIASVVLVVGSAAPVQARVAPLEGIPAFRHVFIIVIENESYDATWGPNSVATYLNGTLRPKGALATQFYGTSHVSADNYMAMTSGQTPTPPFQADCPNWLACETSEKATTGGGTSVVNQIDRATKTWKAYMESATAPCQHPAASQLTDPYQSGYATRHDPFVYYPPIVENSDPTYCARHVVPYGDRHLGLAHDLATEKTTPNYVFITPDTRHDGHDSTCPGFARQGGLDCADGWLEANVPLILNSPAFKDRGVLFITTDESVNSDISGCCSSGLPPLGVNGGGRIGLLALSAAGAQSIVRAGTQSSTSYDHASLLRTVEDGLHLGGYLNNAGSPFEHAMSDMFNRSA
ncbi:MAG: alkaline phosphatase family protein [Acidimicrobiales bacterium]